jgi:isoleucyl-tRNA synthetase
MAGSAADHGTAASPPGRSASGLAADVRLPDIEHAVLRRWAAAGVFGRSLSQTAGGPPWICYEGPPTANGMPGIHHVSARAMKDLFPRFKTMQGYHVPRRGGWDCQGLHVEVAVEKELGLSGKKEIEAYGIAEFNARCRESVLRHVGAYEALTERMGYWLDTADAYRTMDPSYIESVWWSLKVIFERGLLVRDFRISPYCPRCETGLSEHELGQPDVYQLVTDQAATVRFPLISLPPAAGSQLAGADLLVWTTTPWTLLANTAVAVHPDELYAVARRSGSGERVVVADALFARVLGAGWHVTDRIRGSQLAGATYQPPYGLVDVPGGHRVVAGSFVTTADGTGLVHIAPAFGPDDMATGKTHGLPVVNPVLGDGHFAADVPLVGGMFFRDASAVVVSDLRDRGVLFAAHPHEHSYPHCWRCNTPLLYYALPSWFIRTTAVRDQLLAQNELMNWQPPTIKHGRFGDWLRGNVDWALSRTRYWGTPLPLWLCGDEHVTCIGSLAELSQLAGSDLSALDPHRPQIDDVTIACPQCGARARRVPEVIDAWYDSGSMPFAQHGAPLRQQAAFAAAFPAQFVAEGIDQTRGWFYSLLAISTMVFGQSAYQNALCLGLVSDERGRKMSKHVGNVLEPIPLMDAYGADAVRWLFTASGSPWVSQKFSAAALDDIVRKILLTYWNTAAFLVLYAQAGAEPGQWPPTAPGQPRPAASHVLDRWLLSELQVLVREVTAALERFDPAAAGRRIAAFIDEASNWYVRRSRRRFWVGPDSSEGAEAIATLHTCLHTLTRLMAPITPFITDYVWQFIAAAGEPDSVHLASWPAADSQLIDEQLAAQMELARRLVALGRSARADAAIPLRQPLQRALLTGSSLAALGAELREQVADELNVRLLEPLESVGADLVEYTVKPNFRSLGQRFGSQTPAVAAAIIAASAAAIATALRERGSAAVPHRGTEVTLTADDVIVTQSPRAGWTVAVEAGQTVAIATGISPELRSEGLARTAIRLIQEARKSDGLAITDRISLRWSAADPELAAALTEHAGLVSAEVLAVDYRQLAATESADPGADISDGSTHAYHNAADLGLSFWIAKF